MLPQALEVASAWGFAYKSDFVWVKDRAGTGYWSRNRHEFLLIGAKGHVPAPAMGTQWPSVIEAPVGRHSEKPAAVYELIESYFPTLPKIELHARGRFRLGWDHWGNEAPEPPALPCEAAPQEHRQMEIGPRQTVRENASSDNEYSRLETRGLGECSVQHAQPRF